MTTFLSNSNHTAIVMSAPTCSIRYAESDSKGMDCDIRICGAVIADNLVCEGWARFTHPRGDIDEATSGVFATDAGTQSDYQKVANPDSRYVEVEKGGDY